jgi:hypothetical protein
MEHARVGYRPPAFREGGCFAAASRIEERALAPRSLQAVNGKTINNGEIRNKSCSSVSSLFVSLLLLVKPSPFLESKMTMLVAAAAGSQEENRRLDKNG